MFFRTPQCSHSLRLRRQSTPRRGLRSRRESAGGKGVEQAFILQDFMHSRLAGSRGDGVEGDLEQRAGEGLLRRDNDDAAPTRHSGRANGSVRTCSSARARNLRKVAGWEPHRPPISTANTTRRQRGERDSSGYRCRDAYAALLAEGRGRADRQLRAAARRSEWQG